MYIAQPDRYSCGPVAIKNLLEWANQSSAFTLTRLIKMCKCGPPHGTHFDDFYSVILKVCSKTQINLEQIIYTPTYEQIDSYLGSEQKHAVIIEFHWTSLRSSGEERSIYDQTTSSSSASSSAYDSGDHYAMILPSGKEDGKFTVLNSDNPKTGRPVSEQITAEELREYLKPHLYGEGELYESVNDRGYPKAFFFNTSQESISINTDEQRSYRNSGKRKRCV